MMFPGDAMNERYKILYGSKPYRGDGVYQVLIDEIEDQDLRGLKPHEHH